MGDAIIDGLAALTAMSRSRARRAAPLGGQGDSLKQGAHVADQAIGPWFDFRASEGISTV
jgi:hypothetical protein